MKYIQSFESLNEAKKSTIHRAAKKGSYPAVIVVVQDGKVIHQEPVSTPDIAPATFNVMQEKYPKALLHLEDNTGKRLFSESVVTEGEDTIGGLNKMANTDLERIADYADMIKDRMSQGQQLDAWMYSKISDSVKNLNSVHDTMDGNDGINEAKFFRLPKELNAMWELKNSVDYIVGKHKNGDDYKPEEMKTIEEFIKKIKQSAKAFKDAGEVKGTVYESVVNEAAKKINEEVNEAEVDLWSEVEGDFTQIYSKLNDLAEETTDSKWRKAIEGIIKALDVVETKMGQASSKLGVITVNEADKYESVNEGVRISLFDPNKNKILKSLSVDRNYKEAEKEVETLNKRLSASEKNKGYYWKITTIGESLNEGKYFIGTDEVNRDDVLEYKYKTKKSGYKWKQTNQAGGKFIEWKNVEKSLKILIKEYGKGNVVITGNTNGGDPVVDVFVKE